MDYLKEQWKKSADLAERSEAFNLKSLGDVMWFTKKERSISPVGGGGEGKDIGDGGHEKEVQKSELPGDRFDQHLDESINRRPQQVLNFGELSCRKRRNEDWGTIEEARGKVNKETRQPKKFYVLLLKDKKGRKTKK